MSELEHIAKKLFSRQITGSHALESVLPILRGKVSDSEFGWLVSEHDGYPLPEGDEAFENGLPPYMKESEYRLVYPDCLVLRDLTGNNNQIKGWPDFENRLQVILWSLADVEARISEIDGEFVYPPSPVKIPSVAVPLGFELRMQTHKSQLYRICEIVQSRLFRVISETVLKDNQ